MLEQNENKYEIKEESLNKSPKPFYSSAWYHALIFICGYVGDLILSFIVQLIVMSVNPDLLDKQSTLFVDGLAIITSIRYGILILALLALLIPNFFTLIKSFKKYQNVLIGIGFGVGIIVVTIIYGLIISSFTTPGTNTNEQYVEKMIKAYPVLSVFLIGIIGPVCEEIVYRYGLFEFINKKYKWLAYIATIIIFALIHFDFTGDMQVELLNLPSYMLAAGLLCLAYDKFGFAGSVMAHILNNMYAIVVTLIRQ